MHKPEAHDRQRGAPRLLFVTAQYHPAMGGIETHTYEVSKRMVARGQDVMILTTDRTGQLPRTERLDGILVKRVRAWPKSRDYFIAPGLYRDIRRGQDHGDLIHIQGYHTLVAPLAMLAAIRANIPFVVTFHSGGHSSSFRNRIRGLQRRVLRPLFSRAACLIAVSDFEARLFQRDLRLPADRFEVVPNGVDLPDTSALTTAAAPGLIISIGRLVKYKGHERVIRAMPEVLRCRADALLLILGAGPEQTRLERLIRKLELQDVVEIKSFPPSDRAGLADALSRASLVTLLSDYEAHPIAIMEAVSARRPILVTSTSGLAELADRGLAQSIPLHSSDSEVAQALVDGLEQPLVPTWIDWPSWDDCTSRLRTIYDSVWQEHRRVDSR